jgi:hypothetical protein
MSPLFKQKLSQYLKLKQMVLSNFVVDNLILYKTVCQHLNINHSFIQ